jgi:hypothetical protein
VLEISESIKSAAAQKYGEPPYGHAELSSLKVFAVKISFDPGEAMSRLNKANISVEDETQTLQNGRSPVDIYAAIRKFNE